MLLTGIVVIAAIWFLWDPSPNHSDDDSAADEPTATAPADPTKPSPPPLPAAARTNDADGAAAFGRYYFALRNYVQRTNDASVLDDIFDLQICTECVRIKSVTQKLAEKNLHLKGGDYHVKWSQAGGYNESFLVTIAVDRDPVSVVDEDGNDANGSHPEARDVKLTMSLNRNGDSWKIQSLATVK